MPEVIPVFYGVVTNAKLTLNDRPTFDRFLYTLQGAVEVIVKKPAKRRSNDQNQYLWGVVYPAIAWYTGMSNEEVHDAMKMMFLKRIVTVNGKSIETVGSTAKLTTKECTEYIEQVRAFAAMELGINIPDPNEYATNTEGIA